MTKLHGFRASEAAQMLVEDRVNPEDSRIPLFVAEREGKSYTFQVRVTVYNFTEHHKTFTITLIAQEHGRLPVDDVDNDVSNDGDDDKQSGEPSNDEIGSEEEVIGIASSAGSTGTAGKARKKTDAGTSKVVKKAHAVETCQQLVMLILSVGSVKRILYAADGEDVGEAAAETQTLSPIAEGSEERRNSVTESQKRKLIVNQDVDAAAMTSLSPRQPSLMLLILNAVAHILF